MDTTTDKKERSIPPQFDKPHTEEEKALLREYIRFANREDLTWSQHLGFLMFDSHTNLAFFVNVLCFIGTVYLAGPALLDLRLWEVVVVYLFCDLLSGFVHIYLDHSKVQFDGSSWDHARMGFQVHHLYPTFQWLMDPNFRPYMECNTIFPFVNMVALVNALTYSLPIVHCGALMAVSFQATHYWSHARTHKMDIPFITRKLQDWGIILSHKRHQQHHTTYDSDFCILSGYMNFICDWVVSDKKRVIANVEWIDMNPNVMYILVTMMVGCALGLWLVIDFTLHVMWMKLFVSPESLLESVSL
jgi:hypothetical protein